MTAIYLTADQVAERLQVSVSWVYKHKDLLGGIRVGERLWRFPELTESAGSARGIAVAVLSATFLLRAIGDMGGSGWLSWLSPIGWAHLVRPFAGERWWILLLAAGVVAVLVPVAVLMSARRDLGAGVLPPGRARPPPRHGWTVRWPWSGGCYWGAPVTFCCPRAPACSPARVRLRDPGRAAAAVCRLRWPPATWPWRC